MRTTYRAAISAILIGFIAPPSVAEGLREAAAYYKAEHGGSLASAPKIKPDGKLYYMHGKIEIPDRDGEAGFIASLSSSEENELLANALRRSRGMGDSTEYFGISLPDEFEDYYFDNAKIRGGFDVIGRYVANITYSTVSGREMQAPVFDAVYFDLWSKRQPQNLASPKQPSATINSVSSYEKCMETAGFNGEILACAQEELKTQDARLNAAYKSAMTASNNKEGLRSVQRQWIKKRDEKCAPDKDDHLGGGINALIVSADCLATATAARADELEAMRN